MLTVVKNYFEFFSSCFSNELVFKVPLDTSEKNCNLYILSADNFIFVAFFAVKVNGSDVNPEICVIVKTRSYRHTENISLDTEPNMYYLMKNKQKFSNPWLVCILKHPGVMRQIPRLTALPSTLRAKISTKIFFGQQDILQFFSEVYKDY